MAAKKPAAKAAPKKPKAIADKQTKAQVITSIADTTGDPLAHSDADLLDTLAGIFAD